MSSRGKKAGHIAAIKPVMERLRALGFYMSADLYEQVIKDAGEAK